MVEYTTLVQAVPKRMMITHSYKKEFPDLRVYVDSNHTSAYHSFGEMLNITHPGYRLHLQDDCILAQGLGQYIPAVIADMEREGWDGIAFFSMRRKMPPVKYLRWTYQIPTREVFHCLCVLFSPQMLAALRESYALVNARTAGIGGPDEADHDHDDIAVMEVIRKHNLNVAVHYPNLCQHMNTLPSAMGHRNTNFSRSGVFDINYLK